VNGVNSANGKSGVNGANSVNGVNSANNTGNLHIMGLLSDGGVHSHIDDLYAFLIAAKQSGIKKVYIHAFLDGRDVGPKTASKYLADLDNFMKKNDIGTLASLHGRFYAMDRDKNWDRTLKSYKVLLGESDNICDSWESVINKSYAQNITDEFILPVNLLSNGQGIIKNGDGVIFFNFRPDRAIQITKCLLGQKNDVFEVRDKGLSCFVTPVEYDKNLKTDVMFEHPEICNTLKDVLASAGKTMFSIAETEKYAHVTYFFNGGVSGASGPFGTCDSNKIGDISDSVQESGVSTCDKQVLIKSKIMQSYASCPQMSADKITQAVLDSLNNCLDNSSCDNSSRDNNSCDNICRDFYLINYANADMVGHSGDFEATVKAIEFLDGELKKLYDVVIDKLDGILCITADHGKAEKMFDAETGQPWTAHTTNLVPFIFIKKGLENSNLKLNLTQLADIAPFILQNMGINIPSEMKK
jgi:Phosphoglyceromutase